MLSEAVGVNMTAVR